MNFLDLIILIPLLWCGFKGAKNGLVMELVSLLALVAGMYMAFKFSYLVGEWFSIHGKYAQIVSFVIMFVGVSVGVYFLGRVLGGWANKSSMGLFNRIGGLLLSFGKVLVIFSILIYFWNKIDPEEQILTTSTRDASLSFRFVEKVTYRFWPIVQETLKTGAECVKGLSE